MGKCRNALISVSDKDGLSNFAESLSKLGYQIISTGGTARFLKENKLELVEVSELTGFPEMLDGRVKTLHPVIHAGILARRDNQTHMTTLKKHDIHSIDIVVCNLYPFEKTIQKPDVDFEEVIENIDIGGPTLLRAAAKNYKDVLIVNSPNQYDEVINLLEKNKKVDIGYREKLAIAAFTHTSQYDSVISNYLRKRLTKDLLPNNFTLSLRKKQDMRYGENPHQKGSFYDMLPPSNEPCISNAVKLQGKELSFNNILDSDCAIESIKEFYKHPSCVIIKHATPCGIAMADKLVDAWNDAYATDTYSPFGGIVAFNRMVDEDVAKKLSELFLEVIIAPGFSDKSLSIFGKKKNLRLLELPDLSKQNNGEGMVFRSVVGGFLVQQRDTKKIDVKKWKVVTKKKPDKADMKSMEFAVKCVKHVKSNSVLFVKDTRTVAIGGGQTSRVDAAWIATQKGKENIKGSIMASDAFFPFRDAVDVAAKAGVKAIVQPGGSIRDKEVIKAADEQDLTMVFTGQRYFRH